MQTDSPVEVADTPSSQSAYSAARMLAALDTHGPKIAVYLLAAELLGMFDWLISNTSGICA